jgi:diguanylate cyclase (GGDEF)-like protein/PAS domain S-box-containing protein
MSLAVQSETAAGALAAAAAAAVLWRGSARQAGAARVAYRWFAAVAAAWGAGFVAQQALIGPLGGAAVPLTFGDLLSLLALPAMVAGFAALAAAARQQDGSRYPDGASGQAAGAEPAGRASGGEPAGGRAEAGASGAPAGEGQATSRVSAAALLPRDAVARLADGYILAAALFIVGWITLFGSIYHRSGDGAGTFVLALLHPLADLAVLGVALQYAVRAGRRAVMPFLALLAVTVSDALSVGAKVNAASPGGWAQVAQLAAFCLLGSALLAGTGLALLPGRAPVRSMTRLARRGQARQPGDLVTQLAALAAAAAAVVVIARAVAGGSVAEPAVAVIGGISVLALAARIAGLLVSDRAASVTRRESGRQFRELADCITDAVLVCDLDGTIRYASPAVAEYGYTPEKLDGISLPDLIHSEDLPGGIRSLRAAATASPAARRFACRVRSSDGTWRHVEATVSRQRYPGSAEQLLVTARDVSDQVALRRQVTHLTFHDGLTGLPNRAYLEERAKDVLSAQQAASSLAAGEMPAGELPGGLAAGGLAIGLPQAMTGAIFVDLDGFTGVNDSVGHGAGDLLLAQAARRLRAAVPPHETVARWGGDEFAVLVENAAKAQEIVDIAERLAASIAATTFRVADRDISLTASVGVAFADAEGSGNLLRNADVAMSRAKESGGGRVEVFAAHMHADVVRRLELASDLRRAITDEDLRLDYQPIVDLVTSAVTGVEALVRWSRAGEPVPPGEFLGVAEDSGLIVPLGGWVLRAACAQAAAWRESGWAIGMSVNCSPRQVSAARFSESVLAVLEDTGLAPAALTLEVTERVLTEGTGPMVDGLAELRRHGIRLAIDDFGTGHASLAYLRQLPVDIIKIDPSFVAGLGQDPTLAMLTRTIVRVGHDLDIEVVAEGIERPEQLALLREMGCSLGQGFLVARPMTASGIETLAGSESGATLTPSVPTVT